MNKRYLMRIRKWARYASGRSYQHIPQGEGPLFVPGRLEGYFNDLSGKLGWSGQISPAGVPSVRTDSSESFEFAIVIFQWGLAHWDAWLMSGRRDDAYRTQFDRAVTWALERQTSEGGWSCWTGLQRPVSTPFSAMAQGEGLSLLCRAHSIMDEPRIADSIDRALGFLLDPANELVAYADGRISLEEYPGGNIRSVLNGWIFALIGLYDAGLYDARLRTPQLEAMAQSLAATLPLYDTGYWSRYDLSGNLASPFYHDLHITQLRTLARIFPDVRPALLACADRFERYGQSRFNKLRALAVKAGQKLLQPSVGEMG